MFMPSFTHRYAARLDPWVRNVPAEPGWAMITVPVVEAPAVLPPVRMVLAYAPIGMPALTAIGNRVSSKLAIV
jgi:hypothetical protein